jgi:DNA polymerase-3 subunit beta
MKTAIISRSEFRSALAIAAKAVERKSTIPVLANVLLRGTSEGLEIVGTDLDVKISAKIPGTFDEGFAATLPAHKLLELEKKALASESIAIDAPEAEGPAALDFEGLRVSMQSLPVADFPDEGIVGEIKSEFEILTADLLDAIDRTEFAISTEETCYYLNGIFMHVAAGELRFVATDGHRLARYAMPVPDGAGSAPGVIIPRATVSILKGLAKSKGAPETVRVKINTTKALFTFGNVDVLTKLVDGTFPDYSRVIPSESAASKRAIFDVAEMTKAVSAVSAISSERGRAVKLSFTLSACKFSVSNPDTGTAEMTVSCDSIEADGFEIGFNARYVLDILAKFEGDSARFSFNDAGAPALIRDPGCGRALFVVMPMRV